MKLSEKSYFLASSLVSQGVRIVSSFALFRLLSPIDYGAVALAALAPGYIAALGDLGAMRVVYVLDGREPKARGTCLAIALVSGCVLALVYLAAGLYLGWARNEPMFYVLGLLGALNVPVNAIYEYGLMVLNLERNFGFEANTRLLRALVAAGSSLVLALAHYGPLAIAGSTFLGSTVALLAILVWQRRLLNISSSWNTAKQALSLGLRMTGAQYLNNLNPTAISTFVTFTAGQLGLGVFGRASQLIDMFNHSLLNNLMRIFQPDLRFSDKGTKELSDHFCRACLVCLYLSVPASVVLLLRASDVVFLFMGEGWMDVATLLRPLAAVMAINSVAGISLLALQCAGHTREWALSSVLSIIFVAAGYWLSGGNSLLALAVAVACAQSAAALFLFGSAVIGLRISIQALLRHASTILLSSLVVAGVALWLLPVTELSLWPSMWRTIITTLLAGVLIYGGMAIFHRAFFLSMMAKIIR